MLAWKLVAHSQPFVFYCLFPPNTQVMHAIMPVVVNHQLKQTLGTPQTGTARHHSVCFRSVQQLTQANAMTAGHESTQAASSFLLLPTVPRSDAHRIPWRCTPAPYLHHRIWIKVQPHLPALEQTVSNKNMKPLLTCTWSAIFLHFMHLSLLRLWVCQETTAPLLVAARNSVVCITKQDQWNSLNVIKLKKSQ